MSDTRTVTIVPFFNRRRTILATLASVESQSVLPDQLILVDDGSTDDGSQVVAGWFARSPLRKRCHLVRQANQGAAAARNHGLALAQPSEFVAFLDSDDVWPADFLERTQAALEAQRDAVAATCDQSYRYADDRPGLFVDAAQLATKPILWMLRFGAGIASATLFRRQRIERHGGFPSVVVGEDATLFLQLSLDGPWLHAAGEPVVFHHGLGQAFGEERNLSEKHVETAAVLAEIGERFVLKGTARALGHDVAYRRLLASAWFYAGSQFYRAAEPRRALSCFRKARGWRPGRFKYYQWMLRALVASYR